MTNTSNEVRSWSLDHHGLVAATCRDLKIAEKINARIKQGDKRRVVSTGKSVIAMMLNGLGFTNRRLYLTHQFFETKPTELLLEESIQASDLTDHTLGHALDEIAAYGSSQLFGEIAFEVALENDLLGDLNHIDTTSISVDGEYRCDEEKNEHEPSVINLTYGHSKDYRPDLKQLVLSLVVNGPGAIPIFMEPLDGNNSDKVSFHETIKKVEDFKKQVNVDKNFKWVADSALYTKDKLLKSNDYTWLTRVPETIKEAKALAQTPDDKIAWTLLEKGYKTASYMSHYGDIEQRWLLVFSLQAYEREKKTLEKKLKLKDDQLKKVLWHLGNEVFFCEEDAQAALNKIIPKHGFHVIKSEVIEVKKHLKGGRPKLGEEKTTVGFKVSSTFERNLDTVNQLLNRKGRFILATNDLDKNAYPDQLMLHEYKEQQKVEGGFRFIKDPWFMLDSIFLKSPKRIEALMMVMTLCLLVYNIAQYQLRQKLKLQDETLPNQLSKPVQNPTMRWIFQIMEGIDVVQFHQDGAEHLINRVITNINALRRKIIGLFGETACQIYGITQKNTVEILGM